MIGQCNSRSNYRILSLTAGIRSMALPLGRQKGVSNLQSGPEKVSILDSYQSSSIF
jgi:hypothetical protein